MTITATWRRVASLIATGAVAVLLSGCVLTSTTNLVAVAETVEVLPATFTMTTYSGNEDGTGYVASNEPAAFTMKDGGYLAPDGSMTAYFVPMEDGEYLIATVATDGAMYGVANFDDAGLMEVRMVLNGDPAPAIAAAGITGATAADGGVVVTDRATLDAIIALISDGTISTEPLVAWIGDGPAPATLLKDGDWYKAGS
jgi:hypothetical protein